MVRYKISAALWSRQSFSLAVAARYNAPMKYSLRSLMLVVTLKYVVLILRADNHGEGGALARHARVEEGPRSQVRAVIRISPELIVEVIAYDELLGERVVGHPPGEQGSPACSGDRANQRGDGERGVRCRRDRSDRRSASGQPATG